ncbi:uncharacterized protein LOC130724077 [Lotus japonicus]|uniref:Uncharacterized protein n=1 Tax=Lotus japonicus TaxID=34305 RepID=I3S296_LOTJA|nr:uncharacterized protein LOC130724077 [Lotus japonicus]AFK34388.1 unknown [Lotus japonicus]
MWLLMDTDSKDANNYMDNKPVMGSSLGGEKVDDHDHDHVNGEDDSDSNSLLPPRRGGMSRNSDKTRLKVQWNDRNGNKLVEVLEYEPSDVSDSDDDEDSDSCICTIM